MKNLLASISLVCLCTSTLYAQNYKPRPGWKDSYSVGGRCYCDSNGYDHGLAKKSASTPVGRLNVVQICEDIEDALGTGPSNGRIPYNDIQCGHGPANDAADETGCPGRVDIGSAGCNVKGPRWDLDAVYGNASTSPNPAPSATTPSSDGTTASDNSGNSSNNNSAPVSPDPVSSNPVSNHEGPSRAGNWVQCAIEHRGGPCEFSGTKTVAYGAGDAWYYQTHTNRVNCDNNTFGDPKRGTRKACYYDN